MSRYSDPISVALVLPSFAVGGAERVMLQIAAGLDRERFEPVLVVLNGVGGLRDLVPSDVPVVDLKQPRLSRALLPLRRALQLLAPDRVLTTMAYLNMGVLAVCPGALPHGAKVIVREANVPSATIRALRAPLLVHLAYRLLYRRAAAVVCNSRVVRQELARVGVHPSRIHVIPNPVNVSALRAAAVDEVVLIPQGAGPVFLCVGRMVHQKGFDLLLDWVAQSRTVGRIVFLGDGPLRVDLERQVIDLGLSEQTMFVGQVVNPWSWMAASDAFLLPSRWEGLSNAMLEALALGLPVIATEGVGGTVDLAEQCVPGAVTLTAPGEAFVAAMRAVEPVENRRGRESLLPDAISLETVIANYEFLLRS